MIEIKKENETRTAIASGQGKIDQEKIKKLLTMNPGVIHNHHMQNHHTMVIRSMLDKLSTSMPDIEYPKIEKALYDTIICYGLSRLAENESPLESIVDSVATGHLIESSCECDCSNGCCYKGTLRSVILGASIQVGTDASNHL